MEENDLIKTLANEYQVDMSAQAMVDFLVRLCQSLSAPADPNDSTKSKLVVELKKQLLDSHVI